MVVIPIVMLVSVFFCVFFPVDSKQMKCERRGGYIFCSDFLGIATPENRSSMRIVPDAFELFLMNFAFFQIGYVEFSRASGE